jgi:hypothetical protein
MNNKLYEERDRKRLEEIDGKSVHQRSLREQLDGERHATAAAVEEAARLQELLDDSREEVERLKKHAADLESRKRAPLYQRKQEEELQVRPCGVYMICAWYCC